VDLLRKIGIESSGLDISKEMIKKARRNFPNLTYRVCDMRDFTLRKKVDLITCNFDSINHLLKYSDWKLVFKNSYESLAPGGRFLFDMNTLFSVNNYSYKTKVVSEEGEMQFSVEPKGGNILEFNIKSQLGNSGDGISAKVIEKAFEYSRVKKSLKDIGFSRVVIFNKDLGVKTNKRRLYILAQK